MRGPALGLAGAEVERLVAMARIDALRRPEALSFTAIRLTPETRAEVTAVTGELLERFRGQPIEPRTVIGRRLYAVGHSRKTALVSGVPIGRTVVFAYMTSGLCAAIGGVLPRLARAVLAHIRRGGFSYTLSPGLYRDAEGRHAIDEFWLDRKAGFCEHFAAAFVVVMRALDVPARIVTGYQGAERNPLDGYYLVRHSHAHAWAEYWQIKLRCQAELA